MEKFIHAFNLVPNSGYKILEKIWRHFECWQYAWEKATTCDFLNAGLNEEMAVKIVKSRPVIDVDGEMDGLYRNDIKPLIRSSPEFPANLKNIYQPPFLIYRKGAPLSDSMACIAMVGTRIPSAYGEKLALDIAESIVKNGGVIVSGLAYGIDAISHYGAVKNNKATVAVLASGLNKITPAGNINLAKMILEKGGTLISEYAAGLPSFKGRFLERNRIISGLCKSVIIVEAKCRSGALITARHAIEQDREVYALCGDLIRPQAQGCLALIENGLAFPITSVNGLLFDLGFDPEKQILENLSSPETQILGLLNKKPLTSTELAENTSMHFQTLNENLTKLEMKNLIRKNAYSKWEIMPRLP